LDIVADLRAGRVSVAVDVDAPREGRPATRVNWLARQLRDAPEVLRIDAFTANSRTSTSALLRAVREDPGVLIDDPKRDLRTFRIIATSPLGTKRWVGRGGFIDSVLAALDGFYGSVVQQVRPWTARAPQLPKGGRTAAEEAGLDITPPPQDLAEALESGDEDVGGVPPEAPIPEPVLESVDAVQNAPGEVEPLDDDVAVPESRGAIEDELANEELVSWSDAEDRLENERHLEQAPEPFPLAGQGHSDPVSATLDAEPETLEEEKPEGWSRGGPGNASDDVDDWPPK
jgi:hypothetical protein